MVLKSELMTSAADVSEYLVVKSLKKVMGTEEML